MLLTDTIVLCAHVLKAWQMTVKRLPRFLVSKRFCPAEFPGKHQHSTNPSCCWPSPLLSHQQDDPSSTHLTSATYRLFCGCSTQFYHLYQQHAELARSKADNWLTPCLFFSSLSTIDILHTFPSACEDRRSAARFHAAPDQLGK